MQSYLIGHFVDAHVSQVDYHPKNLTNWGYAEVQYDLNVNQGW